MRKILALFFAVVSLAFIGCRNGQNAETAQTFTFTDDYGMSVEVPYHPHRVVSLSPAVTEIMFAIGADSLLVGRTEFCVYPPEAKEIENIGGISNMNIEKVLSVEPDLIITGSMVPQKVVEQFAGMGVPLVSVIEKQKFEALYENIAKIGLLVGHERQADSLNQVLREAVESLDFREPSHHRPTVYYVVGFGSGGNFTAGGTTFINDIIEMAGGQNIASDSKGWAYSVEALMQADPDYVLIRREDSARFCQTAPYSQLSAVREGRTIALEDGILDLQVPRNIEVIERLNKIW